MNQNLIPAAIAYVMQAANTMALFPSLFTAQAPSGTFVGGGSPDGVFNDVVGLVAIPCTAPPESTGGIQATEVRALADITAAELHHVLLNAWYPALDLGWRDGWRCMVDGFPYEIMGVESDSWSTQTRVRIKLATL